MEPENQFTFIFSRTKEAVMKLVLLVCSFYITALPWYLAALFLLAILYMTWIKKYFISQRDTSERNQKRGSTNRSNLSRSKSRHVPTHLLLAINKLASFFWDDSEEAILGMLRREVYPWLKDKNLLSKVCPIDTPTLVEMNMGKKPFYVLDIEEVHKDGQKAYILLAGFRGLDDYIRFHRDLENRYTISQFCVQNVRICFEVGANPSLFLLEPPKISWILRHEDALGKSTSELLKAEECIENLKEVVNEFLEIKVAPYLFRQKY